MKVNYTILATLIMILAEPVKAQQMLGYSGSNYAGIHGLYINPASIADSRLGFSLNLSGVDLNASNNYVRYKGANSLFRVIKTGEELQEEYLEEASNSKPKILTVIADYRGPSFMLALSPKHSLALTTRVRGSLQGNNVSGDVAQLIKTGGDTDELLNKISTNNQFSFNANVIAEMGVSYGRVITNTGPHVLKGGVTVKKLTGIYAAHIINQGSRYTVTERSNAQNPNEKDVILAIDQVNARYGYLNDAVLEDFSTGRLIDWLTTRNAPGRGWGTDVGFVYEYRPGISQSQQVVNRKKKSDVRQNKYKYRLGVSILDVGGITYNNPAFVKSLAVNKTNKELNLHEFSQTQDTEESAQVLNQAFGIQPGDIKTSFRSGLPTALHISLDYKVVGKLYINTRWVQSLRGKYKIAMHQNSLIAITPRLETKGLELAFPLSLQNNYSVAAVGSMVKLGPLFIGSDNIGGLFNIGKAYGANFYAGLSILNIRSGKKKLSQQKDPNPATLAN